ncbi:MAG: NlpC/P60 family protein [Chloroflexota bacterium]
MPGVDGVAVGVVGVGAFLLWTGVKNVGIVDGLRDITSGRVPTEGPQTPAVPTTSGGSSSVGANGFGAVIVAGARAQIGKPYKWAKAGPDSFDCSGLVSYVLINNCGLKIRRMYTAEFYVWSGATTVARSEIQPGDLVCWPSHIGIAVGGDQMINAAHSGTLVREQKIWSPPVPIIRRVNPGEVPVSVVKQAQAQLARVG